jgi:RimJ/RimL family protein N-acetyltransferase
VAHLPEQAAVGSDVEFRREWIEECRNAFCAGERFECGIVRADRVIGACTIHPVDDRTASIGLCVHVAHLRRGVATAVAAVLTETALGAGYRTVRIRHDRANPASGAIAARLGHECLGEEPHSIDAPGQTGTSVVWVHRASG